MLPFFDFSVFHIAFEMRMMVLLWNLTQQFFFYNLYFLRVFWEIFHYPYGKKVWYCVYFNIEE